MRRNQGKLSLDQISQGCPRQGDIVREREREDVIVRETNRYKKGAK